MNSDFAILKAEYEAFKAVVAGRLDALNARVATLEKASAKVPVSQPGATVTVPEERGLCTADTTPAVVKKPRGRAAPLGPGLFDVSSLSEEDKAKLVPVYEFVEPPASPPPALKAVPPGKFEVVFPEYPLPEPLAPVKKARGRPRKVQAATSSDTPTPAAATPTPALAAPPAAQQACASVPAAVGGDKAPSLVPEAVGLSEGCKAAFRGILEEHSDADLGKLWERTFGKPLAKFVKSVLVAELLATYGDPTANFALERPEAIGANPDLKLDPDVEGLDF